MWWVREMDVAQSVGGAEVYAANGGVLERERMRGGRSMGVGKVDARWRVQGSW